MLCSARELGLSDDHPGLLVLPADAPVGRRRARGARPRRPRPHAQAHAEPRPTACRCSASRARSRRSPARRLTLPAIKPVPATSTSDACRSRISAPEGCGRFAGRVIRGVERRGADARRGCASASSAPGSARISALVDVTNYVMLELGRPMHVFDLDKLQGRRSTCAGAARARRCSCSTSRTVEVDASVLVHHRRLAASIGLAGIMGGETHQGRRRHDTNIFLEAAFFFPTRSQGRARRYNFSSDASHRFERGVDFANNVDGIERATRADPRDLRRRARPDASTRSARAARSASRCACAPRARARSSASPLAAKEIGAVFTRLGFRVQAKRRGASPSRRPRYRFDLAIEEDLIEEVARIHGFERIAGAAAARRRRAMRPAPRRRRSLHALRERPRRARLPGGRQLQLRRAGLGGGFRRRTRTRSGCSTRSPASMSVMRTTLLGRLVATLRVQPSRARAAHPRVRGRPRVPARPGGADGPLTVRGVRQPMRIAARGLRPGAAPSSGARRRARSTSSTSRATSRRCARRCAPALRAGAAPGAAPGPLGARPGRRRRRSGWLGELHPRWQQQVRAARSRRCCSSSTPTRSLALPLPRVPGALPLPPGACATFRSMFAENAPVQAVLDAMRGRKTAHRSGRSGCSTFTAARACQLAEKALRSG